MDYKFLLQEKMHSFKKVATMIHIIGNTLSVFALHPILLYSS